MCNFHTMETLASKFIFELQKNFLQPWQVCLPLNQESFLYVCIWGLDSATVLTVLTVKFLN